MSEPQMQPVQVPPQPLPGQWVVVPTDPPNKWVLCIVSDAAGQRFLFLEPDAADRIAKQLVDAARQARTGIVLPPLLYPGNGNGPGGGS